MKALALFASVLVMCCTAFSASFSNASLNGNYSVQFSDPAYDVWSKTFSCPTNHTISFTASGSSTTTQLSYGVASFDGNGNATATTTTIGKYDPVASAKTLRVTWNASCQVVKVDPGHIVYQSPSTDTQSGTYSVQSDGTGTLTFGPSGNVIFQLAATDDTGLSNTALLTNPAVESQTVGSGIAVHQ